MSIKDQYMGFLDSTLLWGNTSLFGLLQFHLPNSKGIISENLPILISENEVLGKRVEHFFEYYINRSSMYRLIAKNIQIFKDKITIGELDFLIEDIQQERILHIELVYKFYVYDPQKSDHTLERWIGPNRKDGLLEKITKLKTKQLPLLHRPETLLVLNKMGIHTDHIVQQVCFFGNLFVPVSHKDKSLPGINNNCIVGFWMAIRDFTSEKYGGDLYYIPQKKDWITNPEQHTDWYTFDTILEPLNIELSQKKSPLLWIKSNEGFFSKCFIVWW